MTITVERRTPVKLISMHERHRVEANCQLLRDSYWTRGFLDVWAVDTNAGIVGHGAIANRYFAGRVIEFFLVPEYRANAIEIFAKLLHTSGAQEVEAQTNVPLMAEMLREFGTDFSEENILFSDGGATELKAPEGAVFRRKKALNQLTVFEHRHEPEGDWVIEAGGEIVATGGFLTHYNPPYVDLYMEVARSNRERGFGSYLIQELRRVCRNDGKQAAARCDVKNLASLRTLEKGGMVVCGKLMVGKVKGKV